MLAANFRSSAECQQLFFSKTTKRADRDNLGGSFRECAGLVQRKKVCAGKVLKRRSRADQNTASRSPSDADDECHGRS